MQDSSKSGHYFLKSKVRASYTSEVYDVTATLSQHSGFVRDASCTCRASAMGRCSHVTGLLYALVDYIIQNLKVKSESNFPVELVKEQGTPVWFNEHHVRLTASTCKDVVSLKSDRAIMNFLNRHLWKTDPISAPALQYGIKHEKIARDSYKSLINSDSSMVVETGFWASSIDPELACSPDGLIMDHDEPTIYGIIEIKCPKSLEYERISNFNEKLTKQQKKNFYLEINDENKITLKTHTNTITTFKCRWE